MGQPVLACVAGSLLLLSPELLAGQEHQLDLEATLARVGAQLERRYERTRRIVSHEEVLVRSYGHGMRSSGSRRLEFERREEWGVPEEGGAPRVTIIRELLRVNGRAARTDDVDACLTPQAESQDPLSALLPARQVEFDFSLGKVEGVDGRPVARLGFAPREAGPAEVTWDDDCVSIRLPGRSRGEAWIDVESGDVLRLDEHLIRRFEFREPLDRPGSRAGVIALQRDDVSIRYERVIFADPSESLMLPRTIEQSWEFRGGGFLPRYYRRQQFSNHRRFVTGARLVALPERLAPPGTR